MKFHPDVLRCHEQFGGDLEDMQRKYDSQAPAAALIPPSGEGEQVAEFAKAILHGDDEHRAWLTEAATAFIAGEPLPPPRGKGTAQASQAVAPTGEIVPAGIAELVSRHTAYADTAGVSTRMGDLRAVSDALTALSAERDEARTSWKQAIEMYEMEVSRVDPALREIGSLTARLESAERKLEEARKALEPFGREAAAWSDMWEDSFVPIFDTGHLCEHCGHANSEEMKAKFTVGDLRRARGLRESLPTAGSET